ncbi:MAG: stage V sporulation protein AE [Clostridia bacterium]|nr:stage V sporulation protein AE [Clostridia bacterium]
MDYIKAFVVGGILCVIAQILIDKCKLTPARILVIYVVAGTALTVLGIYEPLVEFAGCGATIPLTGFGYTLAKGAREGIAQDGISGILSGGVTGAAGGITAAVVAGLLMALIFKPKAKK